MKVLLTGFENFLQHPYNPTQLIVEKIAQKSFQEHQIVTRILPVKFDQACEQTNHALLEQEFDFHLALGLAASRKIITPEVVALNLAHNPNRPDNSNQELYLSSLKEEGALALRSTLPLQKIEENLVFKGYVCELSFSAGTYVCNAVMYEALSCIQSNRLSTRSGFIHLPPDNQFSVDSKNNPSLDQLTQAVEIIISTCLS